MQEAKVWRRLGEGRLPALLVLAACFLAGGLLGTLAAGGSSGRGAEGLDAYLSAFLAQARSGGLRAPSLLAQVWTVVRWPGLVVLLGFSAVGLVGIPVAFGVRGFLLSFSIASFVRVYGGAGGLLAALLFGTSGILSVPVLFVLGVQGLGASRALAVRLLEERRRMLPYDKGYWFRCGLSAGCLAFCVLLEWAAVPSLVSGAAGLLRIP